MAIINGNNLNNILYGTNSADVIRAFGGNDLVYGYGGNDRIYGQDGDDLLYGEAGNDIIEGGNGDDYIRGGSGNDTLRGTSGTNSIYGDDGNDTIYSSGFGFYDGGAGNVTVHAAAGLPETLRGGSGIDMLDTTSWSGNYVINLISGATNYVGESFTQFENLRAGAGNDILMGTNGANIMSGGAGNDIIIGLGGNDELNGEDGNDWIDGGFGNDFIRGGTGSDTLVGGAGDDTALAGLGNDTVRGGDGNDTIRGAQGADALFGDAGSDTFDFGSTSESAGLFVDTIHGFDGAGLNFFNPWLPAPSEDLIDVSDIDADVTVDGNQAFTFIGVSTAFAPRAAGSLWVSNYGSNTYLHGSTDNDVAPEFTVLIRDGAGTDASDYWAGDFIL